MCVLSKFSLDRITTDNDLDLHQILYLTPQETSIRNDDNFPTNLNIMHLNVHGLANKLPELKSTINTLGDNGIEIDILLLCETFLTDITANQCEID